MKIFFACPHSPNTTFLPESNIWHDNLYQGLKSFGSDIVEFSYDLTATMRRKNPKRQGNIKFIKKNRVLVSKELLNQITNEHAKGKIDIFFSYFTDACITIETLHKIKEMGIITINWYCNASYQLHLVENISSHYDFCLVPERFRIEDYRRLGANPIYCQEAADPKRYSNFNIPYKYDVGFVGQGYGERPRLIKSLLDNKINVNVWGPRWELYSDIRRETQKNRKMANKVWPPKKIYRKFRNIIQSKSSAGKNFGNTTVKLPQQIMGGHVSDEDMVRIFNQSKINLGFSVCATGKTEKRILQIRLRDFEVPMSGGFYLVEYMKELEEFFQIGSEIVCYKDVNDLVKKIKYYLKHDSERESIRIAGYKRAKEQHTWKKRFERAFREMGIL